VVWFVQDHEGQILGHPAFVIKIPALLFMHGGVREYGWCGWCAAWAPGFSFACCAGSVKCAALDLVDERHGRWGRVALKPEAETEGYHS
jgi:hypothetical protein